MESLTLKALLLFCSLCLFHFTVHCWTYLFWKSIWKENRKSAACSMAMFPVNKQSNFSISNHRSDCLSMTTGEQPFGQISRCAQCLAMLWVRCPYVVCFTLRYVMLMFYQTAHSLSQFKVQYIVFIYLIIYFCKPFENLAVELTTQIAESQPAGVPDTLF